MFSSVVLFRKAFRKKEQLATWLIDNRLIHSQTNLFFSIKFKNTLSATIRNKCNHGYSLTLLSPGFLKSVKPGEGAESTHIP